MNYAEVVVNAPILAKRPIPLPLRGEEAEGYSPLGPTFHYSIPQDLQDIVAPGQMVRVPFGSRTLQGFVIALSPISPVPETREIEEIFDTRPILFPWQIDLARWLSQEYLSPLVNCLLLMLPPGLGQKAHTWIEISEQAVEPQNLTPEEASLLEYLRRKGATRLDLLDRRNPQADVQGNVERLVRKGLVQKRSVLAAPRVRPKRVWWARLTPEAEEDGKASELRSHKQVEILEYLRDNGETSLSQIHAEVGTPLAILHTLAKKGLVELSQVEVMRDPLAGREFESLPPPRFVPEQETAWEKVAAAIEKNHPRTFLLHGVTGSGKTEIYLRAIRDIQASGKQAIVLVPEIALTPQTIRRFGDRFPQKLAVLHSRLSLGERYDTWRRARDGEIDIIIGSRSAIFAPLPRLGLIVIDEEHEWSYKQERTPRYHAREVAVKLGELTDSVVILGSATPALESYYKGQQGIYEILILPQRIMGHRQTIEREKSRLGAKPLPWVVKEVGEGYEALYMEMPPVQVIDLRQELRAGNTSIFSRALQTALQETFAAGEQVILFLNRRGAASFVMCRDCGFVALCPRCSMPLTLHLRDGSAHAASEQPWPAGQMVCHHCNWRGAVPEFCPNCGSRRIKAFGVGTQRVEDEVQHLFPQARTMRWDRDTTRTKEAHERIMAQFVSRQADVLIGTQMVAKGLDLPLVTLVGVISADIGLYFPDFRAGERTFQLLTQVAGRAGRSILGGKVIIQTYTPEHYAIQAASRHDYQAFYRQEIAFRRELGYPPFRRVVRMMYVGGSAKTAERETQRMRRILEHKIARLGLPGINILGPAPAFYFRLQGKHRWHLLIRASDPYPLLSDLPLPRGWRMDVDPVNLL